MKSIKMASVCSAVFMRFAGGISGEWLMVESR